MTELTTGFWFDVGFGGGSGGSGGGGGAIVNRSFVRVIDAWERCRVGLEFVVVRRGRS
jgi:hypothetical protein